MTDKLHDYGCLMIQFEFPGVSSFHSVLKKDDVISFELDPHVTLLYGFHDDVKENEIIELAKKYDYNHCKLHNVSLFKNQEFDVLKFDVEGDSLFEVNSELIKFPHTSEYPIYQPHMTIAYLKPNTGEKYLEQFSWLKFYLTPNKIVYSKPNGTKTEIEI